MGGVEVNTALLVVALLVMLAGILGTFLPLLPGVPLIFVTMVVVGYFDHWQHITGGFLFWMLLLTVLSLALDYLGGMIGAKRYGASRQGTIGALVGGIVGVIFFFPVGLIVGPLLGSIIGELAAGRAWEQAWRAGWGSLMGTIGSSVIRFVIAVVMVGAFLARIF